MKRTSGLVQAIILAAALSACSTTAPSTEPEPAGETNLAQTLVFNFDGTGNEPSDVSDFAKDKSVSNIYKLYVLMGGGLPDVKTPGGGEQRAFYYKGVGTYGSKPRRVWNEIIAPRQGDVKHILHDAANDFSRWYEKGDRVVVFGFSRGAALAREFVADILDDREDIGREVAFLGVFDTVVEEDGTKKRKAEYLGERGTLNERVQRAVHIVALDEDRITFAPTLINKDNDDSHPNRILEVWFPGVHTDIGGSSWRDGLSDQALAFMVEQCKHAMGDDIQIAAGDWRTVDTLLNELKERETTLNELKEREPTKYRDIEADDIVIHPMVTGTLHVHRGLVARIEDEGGPKSRIVRVNDNDEASPGEYPLVHHSVKERFGRVPGYRPASLRGVKFKLLLANGDQRGPFHGINGLRETAKIVPLK